MADSDSSPYGVIYLVTNSVTGKVYVGQTIMSIKDRWKGHCNAGSGSRLWLSIQKYGRDSFTISEISSANSKQELDDLERRFIKEYRSTDKSIGYNFERGGSGVPKSRDAARRAAEKLRGRKIPPESVEKMATTKRGRPRTEKEKEVLVKMSESNRGRKHSEQSRMKMSIACTGRKYAERTEEYKQKLSIAAKKDWAKRKAASAGLQSV